MKGTLRGRVMVKKMELDYRKAYEPVLRLAIKEVLKKNEGEIYRGVVDLVEDEFGYLEQYFRYEHIEDIEDIKKYKVEDIYVKDEFGEINTLLEDAVCGINSPCEEFLIGLSSGMEDENEMWEFVFEEREVFKDMFRREF